jgi:hypothetical protein
MSSRPHHDLRSIALDARRILDAARGDVGKPAFKHYVSKHELDALEVNILALEAGDGARSVRLHALVGAGVHVSKARVALASVLVDVRDDAKILFSGDAALQHAFGVGATITSASTPTLRHVADAFVEAAHAHPKEAAKIGLAAKGLHALEDLIHAVDGADLAHVHAASNRHSETTQTDSLAHLVSAEVAHLRLVAHRVFRGDEEALARYDRTLPRHQVVPRTKATTPAPTT